MVSVGTLARYRLIQKLTRVEGRIARLMCHDQGYLRTPLSEIVIVEVGMRGNGQWTQTEMR